MGVTRAMKFNSHHRSTRLARILLVSALNTFGATAAMAETEHIRGVVKPLAEATLATEIVARIEQMPFKPGQSFKRGATLVKFDCARFKADLAGAQAALSGAQHLHQSNVELRQHNAIGEHELKTSKSELDRISAEVDSQQATVDQCTLKAPYAGRVVQALVNAHETPVQGGKLLAIINDSDFELELIVPSKWLRWLRPDDQFNFSVDETGETYPAMVSRIGASVDPVSQTVKIVGRFVERSDWVLAGMSGTATFSESLLASQ